MREVGGSILDRVIPKTLKWYQLFPALGAQRGMGIWLLLSLSLKEMQDLLPSDKSSTELMIIVDRQTRR